MAYAHAVVSGEILACKFVRQACQRQIDDLKRSTDPHYPYRFDEGRANRVCWIISMLPHVKGEWAMPVLGRAPSIRLEPWQCFILCTVFGWARKSNGARRFRKAYIEVPRKNGKSILAGGVGNYMFAADGERGAEVYSGATKRKQALEVFGPARLMAKRTPGFLDAFQIEVNISSLTRPDGSRFEPLVRNPGDGSSPSCAIVDEYHEHDTSTLHDAMLTGMGARKQPLMFVITTAGFNVGGPCYLLREDVVKVLEGTIENDQQFGIIYTLDEGDDWKSDQALRKANPNFGVSVYEDFLREQQRDAQLFAHKQNTILTKHFNIWTNAAKSWMNMEDWRACADPNLKIEQFLGQPCWMGCDLAAKLDLASRALIFKRREQDGLDHYYVFSYSYAPGKTVRDGEHPHYEEWEHDKQLIVHDGAEISLSQIQRDIEEDCKRFDMRVIAFDPWGARQMQQDLIALYGEDKVIDVPQKAEFMSEPMKEVQAAVMARRLHHDGNRPQTWAMSNVQVVPSPMNEAIVPRRGKDDSLKKDPVDALVIAMNPAMLAEPAVEAGIMFFA